MSKRILITGITGFVGSHMVDYIINVDKTAIIYGLKRWRSDFMNVEHLEDEPRVEFLEGDLLDKSSLQRVISRSRPDIVFHFASQSAPSASFKVPIQTLMTNTIGTTNLLDELRIAKENVVCDPIIISVSTSEVYGNVTQDELPIDETNVIRAANPYSISKVGHDLMSQYYQKAFGLKIIITRMFSHEGERRGKNFALSSFALQIVKHEKSGLKPPYVISVGNLDSVRTYVHVSDAVRAYWVAVTKGCIGEIYNIGGTDTHTVGDALVDLMMRSTLSVKDFNIVVDPDLIRPTDITLQIPDCSKFTKHTGWVATTGLKEVNESLLKYWRLKIG